MFNTTVVVVTHLLTLALQLTAAQLQSFGQKRERARQRQAAWQASTHQSQGPKPPAATQVQALPRHSLPGAAPADQLAGEYWRERPQNTLAS